MVSRECSVGSAAHICRAASNASTGGTRTKLAASSVDPPGINIGRFDRDDAALVLFIGRQLRIRLVHARHQRVMVGINGEHRIAL